MRALKIARRLLLIGLGLAVVVIAAVSWRVERFMSTPLAVPADGAALTIAPGSSFSRVTAQLADLGLIDDDRWYRFYARFSGDASDVQAGDYMIEKGATPRTLLDKLTSGDVRLYSFTIIEGWNQYDLLRALHASNWIDASLTDEDWPALLSELGAEVIHPEGLFLPETYRFPRGTSDRDVLTAAYRLMQRVLDAEWPRRDESSPVSTPYEALVLASIIEKETARADERARIAGVFARRLERRMRLQTDPTVIYGIGPQFNGNLTRADLRRDTPYNTYTRFGLPPTPIAMPGRAAIRAALKPAPGNELFFVATGLGDGSHAFSATKKEHDAAVAQYLKRLRQNRQGS
ncbi:MAG: endolytic transglycosylase MltG [Gammaproteobacteria bacterium]|nr:endolytic transglycosylase MltG [Gammaproteobacteria bacterium]